MDPVGRLDVAAGTKGVEQGVESAAGPSYLVEEIGRTPTLTGTGEDFEHTKRTIGRRHQLGILGGFSG